MPLITTIAEFKNYISIDGNTKMETLAPYVREAEQLFIVELLGKAFYQEFSAAYAGSVAVTPTPLSADNLELLPYIQRPLAYYAQLQSILHLSSTFGEMGVRQHRGEDSDVAPRWLQEKLQFQALRNGDIHADKLLEFLEANASPSKYNTWYSSTSNTRNSGYIVYGVHIASQHIDINSSRRVFLKLRAKVRDIETRIIPKLIGMDQYTELVTQIKTDTLTTASKALLAKIEPIVCKRALYLQLPFMRVQINENGLFVYSGTDEILKGNIASDADVKVLRVQLIDGELGYLSDEQELRQFIMDNIPTYPLIKATGVYTVQPDPGPTGQAPRPDPEDSYFAV